jgi:alpha-L-rhamnosidase
MRNLIVAAALLLVSLVGCGPDMAVYDLQCEYLDNPLAIDNKEPHFSWKMCSSEQGAGSDAYQILVASDLDKLNESDADLWNSGKVETADMVHAEYEGRPLASKDQAWWKVRVWSHDGEPSK